MLPSSSLRFDASGVKDASTAEDAAILSVNLRILVDRDDAEENGASAERSIDAAS